MKNDNISSSEKSLDVQVGFVNRTKDLIRNEDLIETLNRSFIEFNQNPEYGTFDKIKKTIDKLDKNIRSAVKELLIQNDLKSSEGPAGKFTLVKKNRILYNTEDENADPRVKEILELKERLADLEKDIKDDINLFDKEVPGVIINEGSEIRFFAAKKDKKGKDFVVDYVDYEEF